MSDAELYIAKLLEHCEEYDIVLSPGQPIETDLGDHFMWGTDQLVTIDGNAQLRLNGAPMSDGQADDLTYALLGAIAKRYEIKFEKAKKQQEARAKWETAALAKQEPHDKHVHYVPTSMLNNTPPEDAPKPPFSSVAEAFQAMTTKQRWHAYLHGTDESLQLLASGSEEHVRKAAFDWLQDHEPDSEDCIVFSQVHEEHDAGDWVMRELTAYQPEHKDVTGDVWKWDNERGRWFFAYLNYQAYVTRVGTKFSYLCFRKGEHHNIGHGTERTFHAASLRALGQISRDGVEQERIRRREAQRKKIADL